MLEDFTSYILNDDGKPCGAAPASPLPDSGFGVQYRNDTNLSAFPRFQNTTPPFDDFGFHDINADGLTCGAPERPTPPIPDACFLLTVLPSGAAGVAYTATLGTQRLPSEGDTLQYSITAGALPPGLSLDVNTGIISGTPTDGGTYNFMATLYSFPDVAVICSQTFTITVAYFTNSAIYLPDNSSGVVFPAPGRCAVVVGGVLYVFGAQGGNKLFKSIDAVNWTVVSVLPSSMYAAIWDGHQFIAGSDTSNALYTSPDGITWSTPTINWGTCSANARAIRSIAFNGTTYMALAAGNGTIGSVYYLRSDDSVTWTAYQLLPTITDVLPNTTSLPQSSSSVVFFQGKWVIGYAGTAPSVPTSNGMVATSYDGNNWICIHWAFPGNPSGNFGNTGMAVVSNATGSNQLLVVQNFGYWATSNNGAASFATVNRTVVNGNNGSRPASGNNVLCTSFTLAPQDIYFNTSGAWNYFSSAPVGTQIILPVYFKNGIFVLLTNAQAHL